MSVWLPLFPLPSVVLFPGMLLPLHVFEPRYRALMADVMAADARFGIQLCHEYDPESMSGLPFDVGTVADIVEVEPLEDGRLYILVVGRERFRVSHYDQDRKPYLTGEVTLLPDAGDEPVSEVLVRETAEAFHQALHLTHKLLNRPYEKLEMPEDDPEAISYFIAEHLRGSLILKQDLLEMDSCVARLQSEREVLDKMVKTLAVRTQIEEIFRDV